MTGAQAPSILVPGAPAEPRGPFDPVVLAGDIRMVAAIFTEQLSRVREGGWSHRAGRGREAWTLHDVVGHLAAVAETAQATVAAALGEDARRLAGLPARDGVAAFNREGVERTRSQPTIIVVDRFLGALAKAAARAESLPPRSGALTVTVRTYGRPVRVDEALAAHVGHPVIVHGAQFAAAARFEPPWAHLGPDLRHRALERLVHLLTILYRPDLGGELRAIVGFEVGGSGGGAWWLSIAPEGAVAGRGVVDRADVTFRLRDTTATFSLFARHLNVPLAMLDGRLRLRGNWRLASKFLELVNPG